MKETPGLLALPGELNVSVVTADQQLEDYLNEQVVSHESDSEVV